MSEEQQEAPGTPGKLSRVSEVEASEFLAARFGADSAEVSRVVQGEWSQAYGFRQGGTDYILRFSRHGEAFEKDRLAARFATSALPIPRVVEIGESLGGYYAISERAPGGYLDMLDGERMRATLPALFAALDAIRTSDIADLPGYGGWAADGTGPFTSWRDALLDVAADRPTALTHGWRERLEGSPTGLGPFEEGYERLKTLAEHAEAGRYLIHSDLLNHNVLVEADHLTAVFDWQCGMFGDFLYDVAWLDFWSPWYPAWQGIDFAEEAIRHFESIGLEVPNLAARLLVCELHIGLSHLAYNAFKGRWRDLTDVTAKTLDLARRDLRSLD